MLAGFMTLVLLSLRVTEQAWLDDWILIILLIIGIASGIAGILAYKQLTIISRLAKVASRLAGGNFNLQEIPVNSNDEDRKSVV